MQEQEALKKSLAQAAAKDLTSGEQFDTKK